MHHADKHIGAALGEAIVRKPRVIIADDDMAVLLLLRHVLTGEGYEITEAHSGQEAITLCSSNQFDLAILDIVMPDTNGFDACRLIQSNTEHAPPVLLITSLDDDISVDHAFSCGATEYITKPINWSVFKHRVKRIIDNHTKQARIDHLQNHHPLTGLPNRFLMLDRLDSAILRTQRSHNFLALIMIDINNFKLINETLGHDAGDRLLKSVAQRLGHAVRDTDTLAHTGGDEFYMIIENIRRIDDIVIITDNLSHILDHDIKLDNQELHVQASMGISLFPQDGHDINSLMRNADIALHQAKGNSPYEFFSPHLGEQAHQRLRLENDLRTAIDKHQLILYYQPKYSINSQSIDSMEALVRWEHPDNGLIPPDDFISIAEETGLILPLGEWVIRNACEQFALWKQQGYPFSHISINVSPRQFKEQNLLQIFDDIFQRLSISPSCVELEITESVLLNSEHAVIEKLNQLQSMGIRFALDDFGTGYASLTYLKRLPIDTLKIDRSFIDGIIHDNDDIAIVLAIIGLAKAMQKQLVAEGIETIEQYEKIRELGVDYGQGYYWSRAVDSDEFIKVLESQRFV